MPGPESHIARVGSPRSVVHRTVSACVTRRSRPELLLGSDAAVLGERNQRISGELTLSKDLDLNLFLTLSSTMVSSSERSVDPSSWERFHSMFTFSKRVFCRWRACLSCNASKRSFARRKHHLAEGASTRTHSPVPRRFRASCRWQCREAFDSARSSSTDPLRSSTAVSYIPLCHGWHTNAGAY